MSAQKKQKENQKRKKIEKRKRMRLASPGLEITAEGDRLPKNKKETDKKIPESPGTPVKSRKKNKMR